MTRPALDIFVIVYPGGDRTRLTVADIFSYERDDYALASRQDFHDDADAWAYCRELAEKHGLQVKGDPEGGHKYLD